MGIPIVTAGGLDSSARARFIDRYKPTILACTPSYALYLASLMREQGLDPATSSIRYLFCAGEPGFSIPSTRKRLEETWQAELHEFYGCTEAAPSAGGYTCATVAAQKDGVVSTHLMEDVQIWEVVDENMRALQDGNRGLTVVTNLCSEASPQLAGFQPAMSLCPRTLFHPVQGNGIAPSRNALPLNPQPSPSA